MRKKLDKFGLDLERLQRPLHEIMSIWLGMKCPTVCVRLSGDHEVRWHRAQLISSKQRRESIPR